MPAFCFAPIDLPGYDFQYVCVVFLGIWEWRRCLLVYIPNSLEAALQTHCHVRLQGKSAKYIRQVLAHTVGRHAFVLACALDSIPFHTQSWSKGAAL